MTQPPSKNWWGRNWKWFVPVGCLTTLILFVGFIALIMSFVFGMMKSSDAYKMAIAEAKANPEVIEVLGSPIEEGFFASGSINVHNASGNADLAIPVSGPKAKGTLYVEAKKFAGQWSFSQLVLKIDSTNERVDLLKESE